MGINCGADMPLTAACSRCHACMPATAAYLEGIKEDLPREVPVGCSSCKRGCILQNVADAGSALQRCLSTGPAVQHAAPAHGS